MEDPKLGLLDDDTLPLPADVELEYLKRESDTMKAAQEQFGIDVPCARLEYELVWNPESERNDFKTYGPEDIGPRRYHALAVPITEGDKFIDLLLIGDDTSFETACCRAKWLGRENLSNEVVRLHAHPMCWLKAGRTGACHVALISRQALKELRGAKTIECSDIHTALQAWDWGFGGDDEELSRFMIDDTAASVLRYIEINARI
jgi:hypothetical protein